jgi:3D (Asp-Asp-Asp) domain-containing protein
MHQHASHDERKDEIEAKAVPPATGKNPGDPGYGITAHQTVAGPGTIAAPSTYPWGTQMYVPGYGLGTVLDRGGAIKGSHIDIWFPTTQQANNWGAPHLQVTVCK